MEEILNRAADYAVAGNHLLAFREYDACLNRYPENYRALTGRGLARMELNDYKGALCDVSKAVKLYPSLDYAYSVRGNLYYRVLSFDNALFDYNFAVNINPVKSDYFCTRGNIKRKLRKFSGAFEDLTRAMQLNPLNTLVYVNMGFLCCDLGKYEDAVKAIGCALLAGNGFPDAYLLRGIVYIRHLKMFHVGFSDICKYAGLKKMTTSEFSELLNTVNMRTGCFASLRN